MALGYRKSQALLLLALVSVAGSGLVRAQVMEGELQLQVKDPSGGSVPARVRLASQSPVFETEVKADASGRARLLRLPMGVYRLTVTHTGFAEFSDSVDIRSALPQQREVNLRIGAAPSRITVEANAPLLDTAQPALITQSGRD